MCRIIAATKRSGQHGLARQFSEVGQFLKPRDYIAKLDSDGVQLLDADTLEKKMSISVIFFCSIQRHDKVRVKMYFEDV